MADAFNLKGNASGLAALSICESLLVALSDLNIITAKDAGGVLKDAAAAHHGAVDAGVNHAATHREVAAIIERIIAGGNSIPRF
ncbi:MAG: hypothetical protein ABL908_16840 [Hyphomicrobium sp.]